MVAMRKDNIPRMLGSPMRVLFVCHGNICRSTMAEYVMRHMVSEAGLDVEVASAGTSSEAEGWDVHEGTRRVLREHGVPCGHRSARRMTSDDYRNCGIIAVMDMQNLRDVRAMTGGDPESKVRLLMSFAGEDRGIADPWYTGDFDRTYEDVVRGCRGILEELR